MNDALFPLWPTTGLIALGGSDAINEGLTAADADAATAAAVCLDTPNVLEYLFVTGNLGLSILGLRVSLFSPRLPGKLGRPTLAGRP